MVDVRPKYEYAQEGSFSLCGALRIDVYFFYHGVISLEVLVVTVCHLGHYTPCHSW